MQWLLKLLGVDPVGKIIDGLNQSHKARLDAKNDADRINADLTIKQYETLLEERRISANVITTGMQHKAFWIPWLIATVPATLWFAWGVLDSTIYNGTVLPDVSELPPQLQRYFDIVWENIFFAGGGVAGATAIAKAIGGRSTR